MARKRNFYFMYNLMVNGVEYTREYIMKGFATLNLAEKKLRENCSEEIVIIKSYEI